MRKKWKTGLYIISYYSSTLIQVNSTSKVSKRHENVITIQNYMKYYTVLLLYTYVDTLEIEDILKEFTIGWYLYIIT